jgi:hypothetical protein
MQKIINLLAVVSFLLSAGMSALDLCGVERAQDETGGH